MTLLGGQMEWSDPLLGQDVSLCSVTQQHCGDLHLVLFSRNMQRSVAVLIGAGHTRELLVSEC